MKKSINKNWSILLIGLLMMGSSCMDLNEVPETFTAPEMYYETVVQCQAALTGAMRSLVNDNQNGGGKYSNAPTGWPDGQVSRRNLNFGITKENGYWNTHWQAINNINPVIKSVRSGGKMNIENADVKDILGQALFLRAFNYFFLVQLYGKLMWFDENTDVFTIMPTLTPADRKEVSFIYDKIEADLVEAFTLMKDYNTAQKGRPCKWSAKALLSKVYLTRASIPVKDASAYAKARDAAEEVITCGKYKLLELDQIFKTSNPNNEEFIFAFQYSADFPPVCGPTISPEDWDSWSDVEVEEYFVLHYPEQPRKHFSILCNWPSNLISQSDPAKWNWRPWNLENNIENPRPTKWTWPNLTVAQQVTQWGGNSGRLFPILRISEIYLIYAEATNMAAGAPTEKAVQYLNLIIDRANKPFTSVFEATSIPGTVERASLTDTKELFHKRVIDERRWELCFEFTAYFDVLRTGTLRETNFDPDWPDDRTDNFTPKDILFPIPQIDTRYIGNNDGYPSITDK